MFGVQKSFAQHVLGIFAQFNEPYIRFAESKEISPVDEEEIKMDDGVGSSLASEGIDLYVDLSLHLIISKLRTRYSSSKCPKHVRRSSELS